MSACTAALQTESHVVLLYLGIFALAAGVVSLGLGLLTA